jgi:hypothetical protein
MRIYTKLSQCTTAATALYNMISVVTAATMLVLVLGHQLVSLLLLPL